ncbi:MAG: FAD-dependent oxidoreductase [Egibacteraceae bacterium]
MDLPGTHGSYWIDSTPHPGFPALAGDEAGDVAVLGAGIVGLTVALLLAEAGRSVVLVDAGPVAGGVSGHTTAKVTVGHSTIYSPITERMGATAARVYAESNSAALAHMATTVERLGIDCDWEPADSYLWAQTPDQADTLRAEAQAATAAGLPATFVSDVALPWPTTGAVRLTGQAQFHPRRYLLGLADALVAAGGRIFTGSRATDVDDASPCTVTTVGGRVSAAHVIVATHMPFLDRGGFFSKVHPYREHVVTLRVPPGAVPRGMFLYAGSPTRSLRTIPDGDGALLLVSGEKHRTGEEPRTDERYRRLIDWAGEHFPVGAVTHRWSTQDTYSLDGLPYVGRLTRRSDRLLTATGFNAWGMTGGTLAAMLLADQVAGRDNPWASLYDANRVGPSTAIKTFVTENVEVGKHFFADRLSKEGPDRVEDLGPGDGAVLKVDGDDVAVCRDADGAVHAVSATCTHLGCLVSWNRGETSWDCPCHGSRFAPDGAVLHGPAVRDLQVLQPPADGS